MGESKHTPGPWAFDGEPDNIIVWSGPDQRVCFLTSDGPTEANGALIAAAPELLEALITCEQMVSTSSGPPNWDWVREVIAKATGAA